MTFRVRRPMYPLRDIVGLVCARLHVEIEELQGEGREQHVAEAREAVYLLARRHTRLSWRAIAKRTTRQSHMAALRAARRHVLGTSAELRAIVDALSAELEQGLPG